MGPKADFASSLVCWAGFLESALPTGQIPNRPPFLLRLGILLFLVASRGQPLFAGSGNGANPNGFWVSAPFPAAIVRQGDKTSTKVLGRHFPYVRFGKRRMVNLRKEPARGWRCCSFLQTPISKWEPSNRSGWSSFLASL